MRQFMTLCRTGAVRLLLQARRAVGARRAWGACTAKMLFTATGTTTHACGKQAHASQDADTAHLRPCPSAAICHRVVVLTHPPANPHLLTHRVGDVPRRLMDRFDGILSALAHCQGVACRNPYAVLHPGQPVFNLTGVSVAQVPGSMCLDHLGCMCGRCAAPGAARVQPDGGECSSGAWEHVSKAWMAR